MRPLYERLEAQGFEKKYVREAILPDWWDDSLFDNPSNRLTAHLSVARYLGVHLHELANDNAPIVVPIQNARLKRTRRAESKSVTAAIAAALHAARITATLMEGMLPFTGPRPALEIRDQLLSRPQCMWPDLPNLLNYCWQHGIGVIHVTRLPHVAGSRKIEGLATFVGNRPVIVLCSGRLSQAWLAFHLAHELGHIMRGHVRPGDAPLVDVELDGENAEEQEREADAYAFQILTGHPTLELTAPYQLTGKQLALQADHYGREHRIYPGTVALIYGYSRSRLAVAQKALSEMGSDQGAPEILADAFKKNIVVEDLPEGIYRSLAATTKIYGS